VQGRFTSVDPENAGAVPEHPQTWNGYSYTINNPVVYSDPDGSKVRICDTNGNCVDISDSDANRYFYNKKYQQQSGYRTDGKGNIFDTQGNKIGAYENISCDACSYQGDQLVYQELPRYLSDPRVIIVGALQGGVYRIPPPRRSIGPGRVIGPERQLGTRLPQHAERTLEHIERTGSAPSGYRGGRTFRNDGRGGGEVLPRTDASGNPITYREWDVNAQTPGVNRGAERLVTGNDGSAYYTNDHYRTFIKIK
jgi:guanyl-specific ribonuclease Sa